MKAYTFIALMCCKPCVKYFIHISSYKINEYFEPVNQWINILYISRFKQIVRP